MDKKRRMNVQIIQHGEHLRTIFGLDDSALNLAKQVHRIEAKAQRLALDYCNGTTKHGHNCPEDFIETEGARILDALDKILDFRKSGIPVFMNWDPRGYALKIASEYTRSHNMDIHRDWGGYGILAPDFDGK